MTVLSIHKNSYQETSGLDDRDPCIWPHEPALELSTIPCQAQVSSANEICGEEFYACPRTKTGSGSGGELILDKPTCL